MTVPAGRPSVAVNRVEERNVSRFVNDRELCRVTGASPIERARSRGNETLSDAPERR